MFRAILPLTILALLVTMLSGCIVIDKHHGHGGHLPPGQMKKFR